MGTPALALASGHRGLVSGTRRRGAGVQSVDARKEVAGSAAKAADGEAWEDGGADIDEVESADGLCAVAEECEDGED